VTCQGAEAVFWVEYFLGVFNYLTVFSKSPLIPLNKTDTVVDNSCS